MGATTRTSMENWSACGREGNWFCGMLNWKNVQDENFRRLLLWNRLDCESCHGLSAVRGVTDSLARVLIRATALLGVMKSLRNNPISSLQTPQQSPCTLRLNDSDSAFKAGKPVTDSEVREGPCSALLSASKPLSGQNMLQL